MSSPDPAPPAATTPAPRPLRVFLVQEASGLDPAANRDLLARRMPAASDLVVFPEAFARDFGSAGSDVSADAEPVDGPFGAAVARAAEEHSTTVVAGMFETSHDPGRPFNTLLVRGESHATYRKIHLYDSFGYRESDRLSAGDPTPALLDLCGWRVGLMTCYDLRFPEHARLLVDSGAELLVVPSAWVAGERKADHWRTLVRARAIENTVFVAAAAQPGPRYTGRSLLVDPLGDVLAEAGDGPEVVGAVLDHEALSAARRTNPSLANRRL